MKHLDLKRWVGIWACLIVAACGSAPKDAAWQCGAGAAGASYLVCKALGKSDRDCLALAAGVGIGGAAVCYSYANKLDNRRKDLQGKENDLDARIKYVKGMNDDAAAFNDELGKRVTAVTQSTDALVVKVKQKKASQDELAKARKERETEYTTAQQQVAKANESLVEVRKYQATLKPPSRELDDAIARQQKLYDEAQRQVAALASQRTRV